MIFNKSKYNHGWSTKRLEDLGVFKRGKSRHRPRNDIKLFENGIYPLVQTGEIKESNLYIRKHSINYNDFGLKQSKLWPKDTLCITIAANIAETAILHYPMCFPDSIVGFNSFDNKSEVKFVYYIFEYIKKAIQNAASGSIQDNINIDFLTKLNFKIPAFEIQKQIAKVLSDLDAKIEVNIQINAKLEAMAKALYEYWFVQFDFPYVTSSGVEKPYKSSGGKMVYNEELKREIPEGWEVKSLVDIANFKNGIACQKYRPIEADKYLKVIKIREMRDGFTSNTERVRDDLSNDIIINNGDILFSWSASLIVQIWAGGKGALNQHIFKVTSDSYPRSLVYFETLEYLKYFQRVAELRKTTMGHITKEHLVASRICVPPKNKLDDCLNQIDKILDKIVINKKQNQKLAELRDWLLPMLMNGQITINETKEYVSGDGELGIVAEES